MYGHYQCQASIEFATEDVSHATGVVSIRIPRALHGDW